MFQAHTERVKNGELWPLLICVKLYNPCPWLYFAVNSSTTTDWQVKALRSHHVFFVFVLQRWNLTPSPLPTHMQTFMRSLYAQINVFFSIPQCLWCYKVVLIEHMPGSRLLFSLYIPPPRQTYRWRHYVLTLSVCSSIRSFVSSNLWSRYFENKWTDFDANWHKWSMWQGHEMVNFVVKVTWPTFLER